MVELEFIIGHTYNILKNQISAVDRCKSDLLRNNWSSKKPEKEWQICDCRLFVKLADEKLNKEISKKIIGGIEVLANR